MNRLIYRGANTLVALLAGLLLSAPAQAQIDRPFSSAIATGIVGYSTANNAGSVEYLVRFRLAPASIGALGPNLVNTLVSAEPDTGNPLAAGLPRFQVFLPAGCFVDVGNGVRFDVNGTGCGVEVRVHPASGPDVAVNVQSFTALMVLNPSTGNGFLKVLAKISGFNPTSAANPFLSLTLTDSVPSTDGFENLPMTRKLIMSGRE